MGQGNDEIEAPDPEAAQSDHYHDDGYDNYSDDKDDDDDDDDDDNDDDE